MMPNQSLKIGKSGYAEQDLPFAVVQPSTQVESLTAGRLDVSTASNPGADTQLGHRIRPRGKDAQWQ